MEKKPYVYLASGWFNLVQKKIMDEMYEVLDVFRKAGKLDFFSPFYNGIVLKPSDPYVKWKEVWDLDIGKIRECQLMIANLEGFEPGTVFETGYASAIQVPVIWYSSIPHRACNLMLSFPAMGFANSKEQLADAIWHFLENKPGKFNLWSGEPV